MDPIKPDQLTPDQLTPDQLAIFVKINIKTGYLSVKNTNESVKNTNEKISLAKFIQGLEDPNLPGAPTERTTELSKRFKKFANAHENYVNKSFFSGLIHFREKIANKWCGLGWNTTAQVARRYALITDTQGKLSKLTEKVNSLPLIINANRKEIIKEINRIKKELNYGRNRRLLNKKQRSSFEGRLAELSNSLAKLSKKTSPTQAAGNAPLQSTRQKPASLQEQLTAALADSWEIGKQDNLTRFTPEINRFISEKYTKVQQFIKQYSDLDTSSSTDSTDSLNPLQYTLIADLIELKEKVGTEFYLLLYYQLGAMKAGRFTDKTACKQQVEFMLSQLLVVKTDLPDNPNILGIEKELKAYLAELKKSQTPSSQPSVLSSTPPISNATQAASTQAMNRQDNLDNMFYDLHNIADTISSCKPITYEEVITVLQQERPDPTVALLENINSAATEQAVNKLKTEAIALLRNGIHAPERLTRLLLARGFSHNEIAEARARMQARFSSGTISVATGGGLSNLGCTCYLNAAMQLLRAMPSFRQELELLSKRPDKKALAELTLSILTCLDAKITLSSQEMTNFFNTCFENGWRNRFNAGELSYPTGVQLDSADFVRWLRSALSVTSNPLSITKKLVKPSGTSLNPTRNVEIATFLPQLSKVKEVMTSLEGLEDFGTRILATIERLRNQGVSEDVIVSSIMKGPATTTFLSNRGNSQADIAHALANLYDNRALNLNLESGAKNKRLATIEETKLLKTFLLSLYNKGGARATSNQTAKAFVQAILIDTDLTMPIQSFLIQHRGYDNSDVNLAISYRAKGKMPNQATLAGVNPEDLMKWNAQGFEGEGIYTNYLTNRPPFFLQTIKRNPPEGDHNNVAKNQLPVDFTKTITRDIHNPESLAKTGTQTYEARAVIIHQGDSMRAGHYLSIVKNDDGKWILYNDAAPPEEVDINSQRFSSYKRGASQILWGLKAP